MASNDIRVNVILTVSDMMAERCLRILDVWQEENPDKYIRQVLPLGSTKPVFRICKKQGNDTGIGV